MPLLTIIFTDVVASSATKRDASLGRDNRERDRAYLEKIQKRHFSLIRESCAVHLGREVSNMGDAFYLTFDEPVEAVRCAVDIQKRLAADPIDTPMGPLRLRIGVHSGFPEAFEGGWHGTDVDTAARVEATASERQILLSARTYELVRHMNDVKFHPRGEFALKGVEPMALWEADWDGNGPRPTSVPPLSSKKRKRQMGMGLGIGVAAAVMVAAGVGYHLYSAQKQPPVANAPASASTTPLASPVAEPKALPATAQPAPPKLATAAEKTPQSTPASEAKPKSLAPPAATAPAAIPATASAPTASVPVATAPTAAASMFRYVPHSTVKVEQLVGEQDKQLHQPTLSQTFTRYRLQGADQGASFEHNGLAYFLFGDTIGREGKAIDTIATTNASDPDAGVRLDFLTFHGPREYVAIEPPGVSMGVLEFPVAGISLGGQAYIVVNTNHSEGADTDRAVLTKFSPPANFQVLRTLSQLPSGRFIRIAMHSAMGTALGLPPGGPYVLIWGTGEKRNSDAYLSIVPVDSFESGKGTRYFAGLNSTGAPNWSESESEAKPVVANGTMSTMSVVWCRELNQWLMIYERREPSPGVAFSYSSTPWGPWSEAQIVFNMGRDGALGKFIHDAHSNPDDGLEGPIFGMKNRNNEAAVPGRAYAPSLVERWTKVANGELNLYYVISTWNPYVVVLIKSRLSLK